MSGLENLPSGPAVIVFYHGAIPIDHYYLLSEVLTGSGRLIKTVGDRFLYSIPGQSRGTGLGAPSSGNARTMGCSKYFF